MHDRGHSQAIPHTTVRAEAATSRFTWLEDSRERGLQVGSGLRGSPGSIWVLPGIGIDWRASVNLPQRSVITLYLRSSLGNLSFIYIPVTSALDAQEFNPRYLRYLNFERATFILQSAGRTLD